ncbi:hypothetical protein [Deinococcus radiotolerans]|uniref:Uncharacterized protein n=1 Tax=Deinococcus radiotolerans TaxID=1309407 RepID=A0ABQ2FCQ1_9DEIO|nr:hypothetical protein [Deinococcus radiotolerans]GGK85613.1 hypothetical protein GCM10010844_00150 [Deinococcus radiotolerans]
MTTPVRPNSLSGEDSFKVEGHLKPLLRRVVKGRKAPGRLLTIASPDSSRSSVPVVMIPRWFHPDFHIPSLLPEFFDLFASAAADLLDDAFDAFVVYQTGVYAQILSQPWGVLCALARDAQIWLFDDAPWKRQL